MTGARRYGVVTQVGATTLQASKCTRRPGEMTLWVDMRPGNGEVGTSASAARAVRAPGAIQAIRQTYTHKRAECLTRGGQP